MVRTFDELGSKCTDKVVSIQNVRSQSDGRFSHMVLPFDGSRVSLVYFTQSARGELEARTSMKMESVHGFKPNGELAIGQALWMAVLATPANSTKRSRTDANTVTNAGVEQAVTDQLNKILTRVELHSEWPIMVVKRGLFRPVSLEHLVNGQLDSEEHWVALSDARLASVGFEQLPDWHSNFWPTEHTFLIVYDDDFNPSGPKDKQQISWNLIAITLDFGLEFKLGVSFAPPQSKTRPAWAPFPPEPADLYAQVQAAIAKAIQPPGCAAKDPGGIGVPPNYATTVLMMPRYGARFALCDQLRAMNHQARSITKWTHDCDSRLYCIMCYAHASPHNDVIGWVGNKAIQAKAHLFADADLAGSPDSQLSSSQLLLAFRGTNSCFQTAGTITMVAVELAKRTASLTCWKFWEELQQMVGLELIKGRAIFGVCQTGRYPTKYGRTRVSVAWMYGEFLTPGIKHVHESTNRRTVTAVYGHRAQHTSFTKHDSKIGCEESLALTTEPETKNETQHNWNDYTAPPSVQRRGGLTPCPLSTTSAADHTTL